MKLYYKYIAFSFDLTAEKKNLANGKKRSKLCMKRLKAA